MEAGQIDAGNVTVSCPSPLIAELSVPYHGGTTSGRWCLEAIGDVSCCLPCPITKWVFSEGYTLQMVPWFGLLTLILAFFTGLTYAVLPADVTRRHYLTIAPLIGLTFMGASFVVQMSPAVEECHDAITPNDWKSDHLCVVSGTLLCYGAWVVVLSSFARSLSLCMHLCWKIELGEKFKYISLVSIFGAAGPMVAIVFLVSGISYQFGKICYMNKYGSLESFWGPLLAVASLAFLFQLFVIGYCIYKVIGPFRSTHSNASDYCRSPARPSLPQRTRRTSGKIWHILHLQWRAVALVSLITFSILFLAQMSLGVASPGDYGWEDVKPWIGCLIETNGDAEACMRYAVDLGPSEGMVIAAAIVVSLNGACGFLSVVHLSMFQGWRDWMRQKHRTIRESFARHRGEDIERIPSECSTINSWYWSPYEPPENSCSSQLSNSSWSRDKGQVYHISYQHPCSR